NLVAYLDGELDAKTSAQLKARLASDPRARAEADMLEKTWQLLDLLPKPRPTATFTTRTLQRVSVAMPAVRANGKAKRRKPWLFGLGWLAALGVAGVLGYAAGGLLPHRAAEPISGQSVAKEAPVPDAQRREQHWLDTLPKADRDRVAKVSGPERAKLIKALQQEEKRRDQAWQQATRHWDELLRGAHTHLNRLPPPVKIYVDDFLRPLLSADEEQQLRKVDGGQMLLPTLKTLIKKHPVVLPGPVNGVSGWNQLPRGFRLQVTQGDGGGLLPSIRQGLHKWPDFAIWVTYLARRENASLPRQLGPCRPPQFDAETRQFIRTLQARLSPPEQKRLHQAEGNWPLYPRVLAELAARHGLKVPGGARLDPPGTAEFWNWYGTQ
ncbi:MAG TPA: hypothetical protein VFA18_07065, partial [Gemmataceae bacterium]|nr:hypothetical protein [Gemmataceae bacterium]